MTSLADMLVECDVEGEKKYGKTLADLRGEPPRPTIYELTQRIAELDGARGWMIQGVILDEIASQKRKWRIGTAVSYPEDDPIRWQIDLWPDYEHCYWGAGESFAEAILAAYVAVREAEAGR